MEKSKQGLHRLYEIFRNHPEIFPFLAAVKFICENNLFHYNESLFQQSNGIAMGTNCAPELANLYLNDDFDPTISSNPLVGYFKRFLDDIFFIWKGSIQGLLMFRDFINSIIPGINVTLKFGRLSVDFLDVTVYKENGVLKVKTYQKPLNCHSYLPSNSNHPPGCIKGFIKGELIRLCRTNSEERDFLHYKRLFRERLRNRGYKDSYLSLIFPLIQHSDRQTYLAPKIAPTNSVLPIVLPWDRNTYYNRLKDNLTRLQSEVDNCFPGEPAPKILLAYKKRPSLMNLVCKSALTKSQKEYLKDNNHEISLPFR